jgi:hypothetical protein
MTLIGWVDSEAVGDLWQDADMEAPAVVKALLTAAYEQCAEYAPVLAEGAEVPERYRLAQIFQARALWAMQRQGAGESFNADGFSVAIYPLDARIRQMLRPKRPFGGLR